MDGEKEFPPVKTQTETPAPSQPEAVVFKLCEARSKEKKRAARDRRDFIRERLRDKVAR